MTPRFTIAPGETLNYAFDFNAVTPGPALQAGDTITGGTVTVSGGLVKVADNISGSKVLVRVSCPENVPVDTMTQLTCVAPTSSGEVLVDRIDVLVTFRGA